MDNRLQQASFLIDVGQKAEARNLLTQVVRETPTEAQAWHLLAEVVDNPDQAAYCRKRAADLGYQPPQVTPALSAPISTHPQSSPNPIPANRHASPVAPTKKNKTSPITWILLAATTAVLACLCLSMLYAAARDIPTSNTSPITNPLTSGYDVIYRVEGRGQAMNITYMNSQGGIEQRGEINIPWKSNTFKMESGDFVSMSAQAAGENATITCIIEVNGKEYKRSTSTGSYAMVTCTGWLGME